MDTIILYIIIAVAGLSVAIPAIAASDRLKIGDYAIVRFIRRKGSTTEWKEGAEVQVIDEHIGEDIGIDQESDYTVVTKNGDVAFPTEEQLDRVESKSNDQ